MNDEILAFATAWMDLESIMLNEITQTDKNTNRMISLIWDIKQKETNDQTNQSHRYGQQNSGYQREKAKRVQGDKYKVMERV